MSFFLFSDSVHSFSAISSVRYKPYLIMLPSRNIETVPRSLPRCCLISSLGCLDRSLHPSAAECSSGFKLVRCTEIRLFWLRILENKLDRVAKVFFCVCHSLDMIKQISVKSPDSHGMYEALPGFSDVHIEEKPNLFIEKLIMCCVVFDFSDPSKNLKEKNIKEQTLVDLLNYVASFEVKFDDVAMQVLTKMVAANLFRRFPCANHENEDPSLEPAWSHIQFVYDLLFRFVTYPMIYAKLAERYIDNSFVLKLLDLFDSEDPRERDCLKSILHRVYKKFMVHRLCIRKATNNIFERIISLKETHNGITELLKIHGCIIGGLNLPLKEEHKIFLEQALIPLHKPNWASVYHEALSHCILQFVKKDFKLAKIVIQGLLKYWPVTNSSMEVMFLGELEQVLEVTQATEFRCCVVPLFQQVTQCLNSSDLRVVERALFLWNNYQIRCLITQINVSPTLKRNKHRDWKQAVLKLTPNARKVFNDIAGIAAISVDKSAEFTLEELAKATNDFNLSFKIGQGGFGAVYYAKLRGEKAAIKKMDMKASKQFLAELKVLTRVHHVNLVRLIGYCVDRSLFVVYEYVENGNLQQHLHGSGRDPLPWKKRVQIALDSARGLEYIHERTVPVYIHRDIKSANILIDQSFRAKVADFGLAKLADFGRSSSSRGPMGTFGYMPPEIANGEVSAKSDVFAFGVVLYELISAKDAVVKSNGEPRSLVSVFKEQFKESNKVKAIRKIVDPRLRGNYPLDSVYKMAKLGRVCTQENAQLRPSMSYIVFVLSTVKAKLKSSTKK